MGLVPLSNSFPERTKMQLALEQPATPTPAAPPKRRTLELQPIDKSKKFGVLMTDSLQMSLSGDWQITQAFAIDDYNKCNCFVSPDQKFLNAVTEIHRAISNGIKGDIRLLEPTKNLCIKIGLPRSGDIVKNVRVDNSETNTYETVEWEKVRNIHAKSAVVKTNCYYQNYEGKTTIGFFYQLEKLII